MKVWELIEMLSKFPAGYAVTFGAPKNKGDVENIYYYTIDALIDNDGEVIGNLKMTEDFTEETKAA